MESVMNVEVEIWQRKPFFVEAVQVEDEIESMEVIAAWCKGRITSQNGKDDRYIKVFVKNPMSARQTKAFPGDWILKSGDSFNVYKHDSFLKVFFKTDMIEIPEEDSQ